MDERASPDLDLDSPASAEEETGLQLPSDCLKTPATPFVPAAYMFGLRASSGLLIAASFAAQLARYSGQSFLPLVVNGTRLRLALAADTSCEALQQQLREPSAQTDVSTAAAVFDAYDAALTQPDHALSLTQVGFDLQLIHSRHDGQTHGAFVYNASLFDASTIARFAEHLNTMLTAFESAPAASIAAVPLMSATEESMVKAAGEGASRPYATTPIFRLIESRAAAMPQAQAVRFRDEKLSYGELNARANRLAHHLISLGMGAESRVVVCLEPGLDIAVVLLAVLKAGAVYVPVDPAYPQARIRTILEDTNPALIITCTHLTGKLALGEFPLFELNRDGACLTTRSDRNPEVAFDLSQTAYIFYTSGTTGKPKGVMASHANLIFYIMSAQQRYGFNDRDVMPAIARFSFSISLFELLSPLAAGGTLLVLEREHVLDLARLARTFQEITFFHAGPSLLRGLVAYIRHHYSDFSVFDNVRHASSGGDMIPAELLESLKEVFPRAEVFVIYGCSEVSCMGCTYPAPRGHTVSKTYVGAPFDNVTVRILDPQRRLVPFGIVGEICFAGAGVVKGYLNRPELTAEKFFDAYDQRFYGTGDMGRVNEAGQVEILGRRDFQIQLRGMRIELGEIEHALRKAPGVRDGVVTARSNASGEKTLVAYVVYQPGTTANAAAVRRHMVENLPDYMVPTFYVQLDALPLNHNMKVDRYALPVPNSSDQRALRSKRKRPAETITEQTLAAIWMRLLASDEVGLDDNFFEIGGHSMLAMELILEVERHLGVTLDGMEVLRESLELLARLVDERLGRPRKEPGTQANPVSASDAVECFFFGADDSLYGVFHGSATEAAQALLVCSPIGQESVRAHFVLQKLSRQLAEQGTPVLRFDYFGTGNSSGNDIDASIERWRSDVVEAFRELRRRVPSARITVLGARLGASLAWSVLREIDFAPLVVWDPIVNGGEHVRELRAQHQAQVRELQSLRSGRWPRALRGGEELAGFTFSRVALEQLQRLVLDEPSFAQRGSIDWIGSAPDTVQRRLHEVCSSGQFKSIDYDCEWSSSRPAAEILPDVGFSRAVIALMQSDGT